MHPVGVVLFGVLTSVSSLSNPSHSIPPTQAFAVACYGQSVPTASCNTQALANITSARAMEGLGPISLPTNYTKLSLDKKMVAISNAERTARGLSALPETAADDKLAAHGADQGTDPIGPAGHAWGSIWAGVADPLAADYLWMYDDGPASPNSECQHAGDPGCWGHRDNILGSTWASAGAGHDGASLAELFVQ